LPWPQKGTASFINDIGNLGVTTTATGSVHTTVNALREAFAIQKVLELDARGGTRYFEILKAHFGVVSPDSRLQRPITMNMAMLNERFFKSMIMELSSGKTSQMSLGGRYT
jgi:hypothetical protein